MSNFLGPANVTASLRMMLEQMVNETGIGFTVTTVRPDLVPEPNEAKINLYLFQVTPNTNWRSHDLPTRNGSGELTQRARAAIDLHYLITFYGDENLLEAQRLMASAIRVLHEQPWLTRAWLNAPQVNPGALRFPFLVGSDIDDESERVKFTPTSLSVEEMTKLWTVFPNTPYNLSLTYSASVVFIEREVDAPIPGIVLERNVDVETIALGGPSPMSIPGIGLWLRSDLGLERRALNIAGAPPFRWIWHDQSGNERHASQPTTANQPVLIKRRLRSDIGRTKPFWNFDVRNADGDPVNAWLAIDWSFSAPVKAVTVCAVIRTNGDDEQAVISFHRDRFWELGVMPNPDDANEQTIPVWTTRGSVLRPPTGTEEERTMAHLGSGWRMVLATFSSSATPAEQIKQLQLDGWNADELVNDPAQAANDMDGALSVGRIGVSSNAVGPDAGDRDRPFRGDLAEIIVFERAITESERNTLFRYLRDQYGIP